MRVAEKQQMDGVCCRAAHRRKLLYVENMLFNVKVATKSVHLKPNSVKIFLGMTLKTLETCQSSLGTTE